MRNPEVEKIVAETMYETKHLMTQEKIVAAKNDAVLALVNLIDKVALTSDEYRDFHRDDIQATAGKFIDALTKYQAFNELLRA